MNLCHAKGAVKAPFFDLLAVNHPRYHSQWQGAGDVQAFYRQPERRRWFAQLTILRRNGQPKWGWFM